MVARLPRHIEEANVKIFRGPSCTAALATAHPMFRARDLVGRAGVAASESGQARKEGRGRAPYDCLLYRYVWSPCCKEQPAGNQRDEVQRREKDDWPGVWSHVGSAIDDQDEVRSWFGCLSLQD